MIPQSYPLYAAAVFAKDAIAYGLVVGWEEFPDCAGPVILWDGDEAARFRRDNSVNRMFIHPDRNYLHGQANAYASRL